jgi:hypothetical protein
VRAVDHHDLWETLLLQCLTGRLDAVLVEVGALGPSAQNDEAVLVSTSLGNSSQTLLCDTHEVVLSGRAANGIDSHGQASIGTVLEANGERETRSKLAVELRLGCACADGAKGDQIRKELGGDCVEHLRGNGHANGGEVNEELARDAETLVDLEALVNVWIVDETLPADCGAGLLEVGAHDDADVVLELVRQSLQALAVLNGQLGVMKRAGSDHDEETVILLCNDLDSLTTALNDGLLGVWWDGDLGGEELGRDQRVVTNDCTVVSIGT